MIIFLLKCLIDNVKKNFRYNYIFKDKTLKNSAYIKKQQSRLINKLNSLYHTMSILKCLRYKYFNILKKEPPKKLNSYYTLKIK